MKYTASAYEHIYLHGQKSKVRFWTYTTLIALLVFLFLPWTQTIRAKGSVISLRQEHRPQEINTIIGGRIVKWHVKEGDFVNAGDTIVQLSEVKDNYLDPQLLERTQEQITAKQQGIDYYRNKAGATGTQISALESGLQLKLSQLENKIRQMQVKLEADSMEAVAAANDFRIATQQYNRQRQMFDSGLVSLTQLEQRNQAYQNSMAKRISAENKYLATRQELGIVRLEMNATRQEYTEKMAKAEGDRFQAMSEIATGEGEVAKLQNQYSTYSIRNNMYYVIAPQDGQIVQAKKAGIGEILKEGEMLVHIVPKNIQHAVEMFVRPVDLPLVQQGQRVMFLFDGFPAIVFSGWPQASSGTFSGRVVAVEKNVSPNGQFRVLVAEEPGQKPWPKELTMGTGANGLALLNDVPVWYEIWRNINSFPPDYYSLKKEAQSAKK
ncbi:MAG TPA: HlyD family efflux transporter periplasmic adaptor subunit [Flavisolibacter sp.]|jgi:multidrug resistance efflux pump|nr:HlyD family efflux transporter periplasmic adaptor subunit [Flavisolibacter sp.]